MNKRFRGMRNDGEIIEINNFDGLRLQDFVWIEEVSTMTKEMWDNLRLRLELPPLHAKE